jgi:tRNA1(Val) A37 N6-methylase TrmN6
VSGTDTLLGGRVLLRQDRAGLRATIDPVLLAAAVPGHAGEAVLEAGVGIGTASLCLLARVAGLRAVGLEQDAAQAEAAAANAALNGWGERFVAIAGEIGDRAAARASAAHGPFAHAMANPPWFSGGTAPTGAARRAAKHAQGAPPLSAWVAFLARRVAPRGSVTVILPAAQLPEAFSSFAQAGLGSLVAFPLWPRRGEAARRVIVAGRKGGRAPCRLLAGLVLHRADGRFTDEAEAALRHGEALTIA